MRHARLTRFVDRLTALSILCLVLSILGVAHVVKAVRVRLSRASRATAPATGSPLAHLRLVPLRKPRLDVADVARAVSVDALTSRSVGSPARTDPPRECVEDSEYGTFI